MIGGGVEFDTMESVDRRFAEPVCSKDECRLSAGDTGAGRELDNELLDSAEKRFNDGVGGSC
jgi:hypothetical protein